MTGGQSAVRMNDRHSFPVGGLVELSRATCQSTPLAVVEISPNGLFLYWSRRNGNRTWRLPGTCGDRHGLWPARS
jgi:hypothetical protein